MDKKSLNRIMAAVTALIMTAGMPLPAFAEEQPEVITQAAPEEQTEEVAAAATEEQTEENTGSESEDEDTSEEAKEGSEPAQKVTDDEKLSGSCGEDARWKYDPETKTLTVSGTGIAKYSYQPVWTDEVETAVIEDGITEIEEGFFGKCKNLRNVTIPDSVEKIDGAFYDCTSLKSITLPDRIYSLWGETFSGCTALEEIHLGKGMVQLGSGIGPYGMGEFSGCTSLEHIDIPESITSIARDTFNGCTALKSIKIPERVDRVSEGVFMNCTSLADVDLNSSLSYPHLYYIEKDAFRNCTSLEKIEIPASVNHIDETAFAGCKKLKEVTVLSRDCIIEHNSFEDCDPSLVIKAYKGSKAETYAERYGFKFEAIQKEEPTEEEKKKAELEQAEKDKEREEEELKRRAEEKEQQKTELINSLTEEGVRGDVNGDGIINVFDVMRYKKEIINGNVIDLSGSTDINRNGAIDESDVSAVMNDALGKSVLWSYGMMPKMESNTVSGNLESMLRSRMLGLKKSDAKKLVSDEDVSGQFGKLISGDTDIVFTDSVTEEQKKAADKAGVKLNIVPVAKSGLVFIVNKSNPVDSLTSEQIKGIYSGKITNWKEVGGNDELIVAFQRNDTSDSQRFIKKWMNGTELSEPLKIGDVVSEYKNLENAIGFSCYSNATQMGADSSDIKYIAVDGVKPSAETMNDGTYPVLSSMSAVYTDKASQNTRNFVTWVLSAEGQGAVADSGCIPVKNTETKSKNKLYTAKGTGKEKPADLRPVWNGQDLWLYEKEGSQKLSWTDGMPKSECGLSCIKDKDVEEKINADIRNVMFGDRDILPGSWRMSVEIYNGYMNITFDRKDVNAESVELNYDLRTGNKLEKFSDLFYKNTDFLPLLNRGLRRMFARDDQGSFVTDYFGLSDDIKQFNFGAVILDENNPYTSETVYLPLQDNFMRELMGDMVISEHFDSLGLFEEGTLIKTAVTLTEWSSNNWIKDYSYGSDGKLHYDFKSYYHTPDEIEARNSACDTIYEKACDLFVKEFPDAAGELRIDANVEINDHESQYLNTGIKAFWANVYAGKDYPHRYYYFDPETLEQISISDILGKNFEAYNDKYSISDIYLNQGAAYLGWYTSAEDRSSEPLIMKISLDDVNMKYIIADDAEVTEFTRTKHGIVDSENALVYPESYVVKHDPEKKGEPVQKGYKVEIRNYAETLGEIWYECWNAENGDYCGWIAKDNITEQYTEDENKMKLSSFDDQPVRFELNRITSMSEIISYTNESVMDAGAELEKSDVDLSDVEIVYAKSRCVSHGRWMCECWLLNDTYLGWIDMHDLRIDDYSSDRKNYPEKLESEISGIVPGEKYNGIDFYAPKYIVADTKIWDSAGRVSEDIKIRTGKRCDYHGEWWYECTSAEGGRYLGWVNGDLIEFEH